MASDVEVLWVTASTSRVLSEFDRPDAGRFQLCAAEYQTAGKGRRGRQWLAPFGDGICLSLSWSFAVSPPNLACLGLAVGVGLLRALGHAGVEGAQLK